METPTQELKTAMASLYNGGAYSDLTILCGGKRYAVHRALLTSRSSFFNGACRNPFLEAETAIIDLSEDDAEAVEHMVHYFYHMDYLEQPLFRRSLQRSQRSKSPRSSPNRTVPKKLNLAFAEDPLLASMDFATPSNALPLTPPADKTTSFKFSNDAPIVDQSAIDGLETDPSESGTDVQTSHLVTHAKVYAIAEKYGITGLKAFARQKFLKDMALHLDTPSFPEACQEVYESTFHTDRGLRDVVIQTFRANPTLSLRPDVEMAVRETPGLAFELYRMASGLPVA